MSDKLLLVEDDENIGFIVQDQLSKMGYEVVRCTSAKEGIVELGKSTFDICVLDVMMPVKNGFELAEDIRKIFPGMPFVFLTSRHRQDDKNRGLELGAEDYITKPFDIQELNLRIRNILRRYGKKEEVQLTRFNIGSIVFDAEHNNLIHADGKEQHLTPKEAALLKILSEEIGKLRTRESMANLIWGEDSYFVARTMDVYIAKLRKYLQSDSRVQIVNIHSLGFQLTVEG